MATAKSATAPTPDAAPSATAGPPLDTISGLLGGPRIDDLLRSTAGRAPDRLAIATADRGLTFAELDARADGLAVALHAVVGSGTVVALAMVLDPSFAIAFNGIARSGNVSALVNPLLREEGLLHVLRSSGARVAIVPPDVHRRIEPLLGRLPELELLVLTHRNGDDAGPERPGTLEELIGPGPHPAPPDVPHDEHAVACMPFTSGTTGAPKAVRLTHRNITVNAAQTVHGHRLTESSVLFNYLPTFHLMHLNIGVLAGATHVLHSGDDVAEAIEAAARFRATHLYSLPMRLSRLAADPRLHRLEAPALQAVLSGGSALPPAPAAVLSQHFGIPVVQGYGLAETSPVTHLSDLDLPRNGSSGRPVPGTECRIVDVATRAVVPFGARGEIQVRGPQLMLGYLGRDRSQDLDADGWFATGDIGWCEPDGTLFVVDRIKDVFKCDNWLVSPTQIERVLLRHPAVADCAVVDVPDEHSGAVAHGLVVLRPGGFDPAALIEFVNSQLPYYEHLRTVDQVADIPRSPTGKVLRQELRERLRTGDR